MSLVRSCLAENDISSMSSFYVILVVTPILYKLLWGFHFTRMTNIVTSPAEMIRSERLALVRIGMISKIMQNAEISLKIDDHRFR